MKLRKKNEYITMHIQVKRGKTDNPSEKGTMNYTIILILNPNPFHYSKEKKKKKKLSNGDTRQINYKKEVTCNFKFLARRIQNRGPRLYSK